MTYKEIPIEQIKMTLTQMAGCYLNDVIWIPLSPLETERIASHFREKALKETESYLGQGLYRQLCDYFEGIVVEYKKRREEIQKGKD